MLLRGRTQRQARSKQRGLAAFLAVLGALVLLASPVSASAAGTLDQSQTGPPNGASFIAANNWSAQTFTAGKTGNLDHVDVNLASDPCDPGPLTVQIRTTSGGTPTSTVLAQTTVPSSSVPANGENNPSYVSVSFTPRPPSVSGTQYAIVLGAPSASGCAYVWWGTSGNPYAGGQVEHSTNGGSSWTAASAFDFDFRTFVVQKAPGATTRGASNVSRNGATLHGTVNPQGQPTSFHFEFGTSKSYGKQTPSKGAGSDSSNHSVAQAIKGLKPNTVYHYRIVATNASGTTRGQDRTFRTRAASTPSPGPGPTCGGSANAGVNQQQRNPGTGNQGALGQQNAC